MSTSNQAYSEAATSGKYDRGQAFYQKYDNVRIFWEDALTRKLMKTPVAERLHVCREQNRGLRILDLGCGSGDGFEMFLHFTASEDDLRSDMNRLITYDDMERYTGVDLNQDLLNQNAQRWGNDPKLSFCQGDLSKGFPTLDDNNPYDVYFAGYGTFSHFTREQTVRLLSQLVTHAPNGAVLIGDWLGRFSYEWQDLWDNDLSKEQWMDYYISYIYPPEERKSVELSPLPLRLVTQQELLTHVINPVQKNTGAKVKILGFYDRSIFIGRHMDTGDYNHHTKPLRQFVNSLFERSTRTPLHELVIEYHPHNNLASVNDFFQHAFNAWNEVVKHCAALCYGDSSSGDDLPANLPPESVTTIQRFKTMMEHLNCFYTDDIRADVLEMQLGFLLRDLEFSLQRGRGNGHGLVGIFEIQK